MMLYGDGLKMCEDLASKFGDKRTSWCITLFFDTFKQNAVRELLLCMCLGLWVSMRSGIYYCIILQLPLK
jgi:hypothetical protein